MTVRPPVEQHMENQARKALAALRRWELREHEATSHVEAARNELADIHRRTCERFGREVPADALLLDVLDLVEIEDGDRWLWRGMRNNKGFATVRDTQRREVSLVRFLAIAFGVIEATDFGVLYPIDGDIEDVNPWHRTLRHSDQPIGNPGRFTFQIHEDNES